MALTLGWLLSQPDLQTTLLIGDMSTELDFVQTTDLFDPRDHLIGGELVLVTGLGFPRGAESDVDDFGLYVERLAERGVAALGVGLGIVFPTMPTSLVYAARQHGLPLFAVPPTTPFASVTKLVMSRLADEQYADVAWSTKHQSRLNRSMARDGIVGLVKELADATDGSAALIFYTDQVLAAVGPQSNAAIVEAQQSLRRGAGSGSTETPDRWSISHVVRVDGVDSAALALVRPTPLPPMRRLFIAHAVSLAEIYLDKPEQLRKRENAFRTKILQVLLEGSIPFESVELLLDELGGPMDTVRALYLKGPESADMPVSTHIARYLQGWGQPLYLAPQDAPSPGTRAWMILLRSDFVPRSWTDFFPAGAGNFSGAVSGIAPVRSARALLEEARLLAQSAKPGAVATEQEIARPLILDDPALHHSVQQRGEMLLSALRREDQMHGTELVRTLHVWLLENGASERAARRLGVHRQTLRTRLEMIRTLLPVNIDSAPSRAEILLSLIALESRAQ